MLNSLMNSVMKFTDIKDALLHLGLTVYTLETSYEETGGEVTPETEKLECIKDALRELLTTEGVDSLGRWLKAKQDEIATVKAEKAQADRRLKSLQRTEEFIKSQIAQVLRATETDKVAGTYYNFQQAISEKNTVNSFELEGKYLEKVQKAARKAGLPECIDVELKTTTTRLKEAGMAEYVLTEQTPTVAFRKPRSVKE